MSVKKSFVLDACAVIAYLNDEEGAQKIDDLIHESTEFEIAAINALEVAYDSVKVTGSVSAASEVLDAITRMPCRIEWELNRQAFLVAAMFKAQNRISLADSVALAFAKVTGKGLLTSDHHEFDTLAKRGEVDIIWIR